jgi:hypothetical protein
MNRYVLKSLFSIKLVLFMCLSCAFAHAQNPNFFYIIKGEPIQRGINLGDPTNWSTNIQGRQGESAGKKVAVALTTHKVEGDAIQITWNKKKTQGNFSISGNPIDLSKVKDSAYLTLDIRMDQKPDKTVKIGMDCGYPCRAELTLNGLIKQMPKGEWFSLPIPLNCFKSDNFDLSKINSPLTISTDGRFTLSITNVRLEKMPEGEKGCVEDK